MGSIVTAQIEPCINTPDEIIINKAFFLSEKNKGKTTTTGNKNMESIKDKLIGHFRVPKTFAFKMRLGAQPFL